MLRPSRLLMTLGLTALCALGSLVAAQPAAADPSVNIQLGLSAGTVVPGATVTVTETVTNPNGFTILQPTLRLFSSPNSLTGYTTLVGCNAGPGGSCGTIGSGYGAVLGSAVSGFSSATVTFTLSIDANAPGGPETIQGQLVATNFTTGVINGPTLVVDAKADVAVGLTGAPEFGLLVSRLVFTVTAENKGPDRLVSATVTATLPAGLTATSSACGTGSGRVTCQIGALAPGASRTATFSVPLGLLDIGLPYSFSATRTASVPVDPNPANDSAHTTCTVLTLLLASCG